MTPGLAPRLAGTRGNLAQLNPFIPKDSLSIGVINLKGSPVAENPENADPCGMENPILAITELEDVQQRFVRQVEAIYSRLIGQQPDIAIPQPDRIVRLIERCSFRMFEEPEDYENNPRAKEYSRHISSTFGDYAYRVYFNTFSKRIYVDLNRDRISLICLVAETEVLFLCELIRSIMVADPRLFG